MCDVGYMAHEFGMQGVQHLGCEQGQTNGFLAATAPTQTLNPLFRTLSLCQVFSISAASRDTNGFSDHCEARETAAEHAAASCYSMDAPTFYELFPYHLILDNQCRVLQVCCA